MASGSEPSMKVSTRGDYAARALLSLALHGSDRPTSVKEIAERTGLPQPYLEQILLAVKGAGLVRSKRGVGGGYVLAREPTEITLADILAAVDGPLTTLMGEHDHCEGHCVLQEVWVGVSDETRQIFERFTLQDLVERTRVGHPDGRGELTQARRLARAVVRSPDACARSLRAPPTVTAPTGPHRRRRPRARARSPDPRPK